MTEIRDAGAIQYKNTTQAKALPKKAAEENVKPPADEVTLSKPEKSLAKKIIELPGKIIKGTAGVAVGVASAPLNVLPGAVKGLHEATAGQYEKGKSWPFHFTMFAQNLALGGGAGFMMGGPIGAAIGAGGALGFTVLQAWIGDRTEAHDKMMDHIDQTVERAKEDNTGTKTEVAFQNATEGAIIGGVTGTRGGWHIGYETGKGIVSGVVGIAEGVAEGAYEVGKNVVGKITGKGE